MEEKLREYAKLLIEVGLNVQKGQTVVIRCPVECAFFARLCASAAYDVGCREVVMRWSDDYLSRERFLRADDSVFDSLPLGQKEFLNGYAAEGAAYLSISARDPEVLRGVDLTVEKGDVVAILGPSGSGKTTLLRCLNFLETADAGQLVFDGESFDLAHASRADIARLRKKTAFVFQNYNLFRNKTALQNVSEGLIVARKLPKEQADEIGMKMLAKVGLADRADYYPRQLSGGQQQRVAIARALAADPEIIYFDEPTSALDPELTGEVLSVMRQLAEEGMTMLVVTHEMGFARNVSSKTVFMENGVVVEQAPSQQFFASPKEERTRAFLRRIAHTE